MSASSGTSQGLKLSMTLLTYDTPNSDVSPSPRNITTSPVASWFVRNWMTISACTMASAPPASAPATTPAHGLPNCDVAAYAANALASIEPSMPRLITPDRSDTVSPSAANRIDVPPRTAPVDTSVMMSL